MTPERTRLVRLYYAISFFFSLDFRLPIWVLFGHDHLGLPYLAGIALVALPDLIAAVVNVPMGAASDRYGRRRIYRLGLLLWLGASLPYVLTTDVRWLLLCVPVAGIGAAMASGSLDAIVSAVLHDRSDDFRVASSNSRGVRFAARILASIAGGLLYVVDPRLPFAALAGATLIALVLAFWLPASCENAAYVAAPRFAPVRETLALFRSDRGLTAVLILMLVVELLSNMLWIAYQPAMQSAGIAAGTLGLLFAAFSACSLVGTLLAKRLMRTWSTAALFRAMLVLGAVTAVGMITVHAWTIVLMALPLQLAFGLRGPVSTTYVATRTPVHIKSTALSLLGVTDGVWVVASLLTGLLLDGAGVSAVGLVVAVGSMLALLAVPRSTLRGRAVAAPRELMPAPAAGSWTRPPVPAAEHRVRRVRSHGAVPSPEPGGRSLR